MNRRGFLKGMLALLPVVAIAAPAVAKAKGPIVTKYADATGPWKMLPEMTELQRLEREKLMKMMDAGNDKS